MDRHSMARLRLDRRLIGRRNWISEQEFARELQALPDVSDKIAPPEEPEPSQPAEKPRASGGHTHTSSA